MRVVSWNVNGIRAGVRHGFVDFVDRSGADIVGVQEVRAWPEDIPPAARRPPGWHTAFTVAERRGYSGVGLYSKLQPIRVDTSLGVPRFDREGRFMAGHFQTARGRFVVVNGYFPKGSGPDRDNSRVGYKLDFSRTVFARAQELWRRGPVLVIGDYNTAHRAIDLARPQANVTHSGFLPEERAELDRWIDAGWVDAFRTLHPEDAWPVHVVAAVGRRARAEHRMADRLRLRIAGCDEAHTRGLYLARRTGFRPLPGRCRYRPVADTSDRSRTSLDDSCLRRPDQRCQVGVRAVCLFQYLATHDVLGDWPWCSGKRRASSGPLSAQHRRCVRRSACSQQGDSS